MKIVVAGFSANVLEALISTDEQNGGILQSIKLLEDSQRAIEEAKMFKIREDQIHSFKWLTKRKYEEIGSPELINCVASKPQLRKNIFEKLRELSGEKFRSVSHANNLISSQAMIETGVFLDKYVTVEAFCEIGNQAFINSHSHVGHNSTLQENVILGGGVVVNGYCRIGADTLLGSGVIVSNRVKIGDNCLVQAGSVVLTDIPDESYVAGNPAKVICSTKLFTRFNS